MRLVFWVSFLLVAHAYFGYPLALFVFGRQKAILKQPATPTVSILMAVRNEEARLEAKLENLRRLDYPRHLTEVIVVSDGSTDRTASILERAVPGVIAVLLNEAGGKALALNEAVRHASGEILVFLDVRQSLDPNAVSELVCCFADPRIGAVSGELVLEAEASSGDALGLYWKIEKAVRRLESSTGSVIGVTGAIYALRRELYTPMPPGTILDDVFIPMHVVRAGRRVVFQPTAIARDRIFSEPGKEFARKVRTLTGNYQLVRLAPWLLSPANPVLFRFISHKMLRLPVPLFLLLILVCSAADGGPVYTAFFWMQVLFFALAAIGVLAPAAKKLKPVAIASTFVMLNAAAVLAFYNFVTDRREVWR
jgi:cellulose synthase/poly-beta-1,6-N-acetylglucosamine synthase-like glycosyltransferase